jgi:hypothetical protein
MTIFCSANKHASLNETGKCVHLKEEQEELGIIKKVAKS